MKIAVINEISTSHRNADVLDALGELKDAEVYNLGMTCPEDKPELTYIHTGLMSALVLNLDVCDMVIGGCGTGQGYLNSVMQYPNVFCGLLTSPLDAWLFSQINGGNCVSLALNKGYGWAADRDLKFIAHALFQDPAGRGYPLSRSASQAESRKRLKDITAVAHLRIEEIVLAMDSGILKPLTKCDLFMQELAAKSRQLPAANKIYEYFSGLQ